MKKLIYLFLAVAMVTFTLAGCGTSSNSKTSSTFKKTTPDTYPIETDKTLTYWVILAGHVSAHSASLNDTRFAEGLIKKTGIKVEFIHPVTGQEDEQFNLMLASGDMPDIIENKWNSKYPGGVEKAIEDGIILPLNNIMEQVSPNIMKFFEENPDIKKLAKSVSGKYYGYPMILKDERLMTFRGPMVREDLLKKAGLDEPETIKEWDTMLKKFKDMGIEAPVTLNLSNAMLGNISPFMGAYGIVGGFYIDNGVVKYGPYETAYKDFVTLMTNWYSDGLLDKNFTDTDTKRVTALVSSGKCGSTFGAAGGDFGVWIPALQANIPDASFVPVKYPVMNKGDRPMYGQKTSPVAEGVACITSTSKNVELAARLLDYGYSEEGHMYYNFGIEGESYTMVDGKPVYTDIITDKNKNGNLGVGAAMGRYIRACYTGPFVQDVNYLDQFFTLQVQRDAATIWSDTDALKHQLPMGIMTSDENKEYSKIMSNIDVYKEEILFKTITGRVSIGEFDTYFEKMKNYGIERAIEIYQNAYNRYMEVN